MRNRYARLSAVIALLTSLALAPMPASPADTGHLPATVAQALKTAGIPTSAVGIHVQQIGSTRARLGLGATQAMNPASVMKLVTTYAALETLGPAYTWTTEAWAAGELSNGVLAGDLYLRGSGDPRLTFEDFWLLLRQLRARGVSDIRGALVLDHSRFAVADHDPGRFDQEPMRAYNVGPDALLLNFKALRIEFSPDAAAAKVALRYEPQPTQLEVVNMLKLGNGPCNDWKDGIRVDASRQAARARLVITGSFPAACGERDWNLGVLDHSGYVSGVFRQLWQELGGKLGGEARDGLVPAGSRLIASHQSPPLTLVVHDINKWSNNVMARQLLLTLGAESAGGLARAEDGAAAVRAWLDRKKLPIPELLIENGAGLSRAARISAESLGRLLQAAYASRVMPEFIASLPIAATDGTMKKRLSDEGVAGNAHIKTGSLEGVKSIAGYVLDSEGRRWTVVFLVNHANAAAARSAQDALLAWVYAGAH